MKIYLTIQIILITNKLLALNFHLQVQNGIVC